MIDQVQSIKIKGIREGILVKIDALSFEQLVDQLHDSLVEKQAFLRGSRVALQIGNQSLRRTQIKQIQAIFEQHELVLWALLTDHLETRATAREMNLGTRLAGSQTDLDGNKLSSSGDKEIDPARIAQDNVPVGLVLKKTLRSGRSIYHEGSVVVIGDVNPGAEIVAGGDVIVWGRLRGFVHAGAMGDETAVICALHLHPTQLRIAGQIAISPEGNQETFVPERVSIRQGQIIAESWPQ